MRKIRIFYGWWICLGGALVMGMSAGINFHGFGNFIIPLSREFGWSRTVVSAIFSVARLESGFIGPVEGWAVDKIGPRKLMLIGIPLMGLGFVSLYWVNGLTTFLIAYVLGVTLGNSLGMHTPVSAAVANWFNKRRGLAFGIMWSGVGIGGVFVPLLGWAVSEFGWRQAALFTGIFVVVAGLPVAAIVRHRPEQYGLLPDGVTPTEGDTDKDGKGLKIDFSKDYTARQALRTSSFWFLSLSIAARSLVSGGVGLHLVPYFIGLGSSPVQAATYAGSVGIMSIPGRFGLSYLGDFLNRRYTMAACLFLMTVSILMLAGAESIKDAVPAMIVYSIAQGGISVIPQALIADYFGRRAFATITGFRSMIQMSGIIIGPVVSGYMYDKNGTYEAAFIGFAGAAVVSLVLVLMAFPPKTLQR